MMQTLHLQTERQKNGDWRVEIMRREGRRTLCLIVHHDKKQKKEIKSCFTEIQDLAGFTFRLFLGLFASPALISNFLTGVSPQSSRMGEVCLYKYAHIAGIKIVSN